MDRKKIDNIQLEDLVYSYPSLDNVYFQDIISRKQEFINSRSSIEEKFPEKGKLFKHQNFFLKYMIFYDRLLLFHEPGSGKSCTSISLAEHLTTFIAEASLNYIDNYIRPQAVNDYIKPQVSNIKRIIYLSKGKTLIQEFIKQITDKCTDRKYYTPNVINNSFDEIAKKIAIQKELNKYYDFYTFGVFANKIFNNLKGENLNKKLKEEFSDCYFIIDEAHNLRSDKDDDIEEKGIDDSDFSPLEMNNKNFNSKDIKNSIFSTPGEYNKNEKLSKNYKKLYKIFHTAERIKIILLTGTPMVNNTGEIAELCNLLLPVENILDPKLDYSKVSLEYMEKHLRGIISFIRSPKVDIEIEEIGEKDETVTYTINNKEIKSETKLFYSKMSQFQETIYKRTVVVNKGKGIYVNNISASNFVFPNKYIGSRGFNDYIINDGQDNYKANTELKKFFKSIDLIRLLSTKYATILEIEKTSEGKTWIYNNSVTGSGLIVLGLCFEEHGYEKFKDKRSPFINPEEENIKKRKLKLEKRKRYALITSETPEQTINIIKDLFNSYENRYGDYLKLILGSRIAREGLNLENVLNIHICAGQWNYPSIYQAQSRAIRVDSHNILINELKEKREKGLTSELNVKIKMYKHAAYSSNIDDDIDRYMYYRTEEKDIKIRYIYRMLKQIDIGCSLNKNRNIREEDVNYSQTCDYDICNYTCFNEMEKNKLPDSKIINDSNFVLYNDELELSFYEKLKILFKVVYFIIIDDIYILYENLFSKKSIDFLLNKFITEKTIFYNKLGVENYLVENRNIVYLTNIYPFYKDRSSEKYLVDVDYEYSNKIIRYIKTPLEIILKEKNKEIEYIKIDINCISIIEKIQLVENAIINKVACKCTDFDNIILETFKNYIFSFVEPINAINLLASKGIVISNKKGRRLDLEKKILLERNFNIDLIEFPEEDENGTVVYVHTLNDKQYSNVLYNINNQFNRNIKSIKILRPPLLTWSSITGIYFIIYSEKIKRLSKINMDAKFKNEEIYGTLFNNEFRIIDNKMDTGDEREKNTGKICINWKKYELINFLWKLNIKLPEDNKITKDISRDEILGFLNNKNIKIDNTTLEELSLEKLKFFYNVYKEKYTTDEICKIIKQELEDRNLLEI